MKLIAHRGCTRGPSDKENHPDFIQGALNLGFDVEVDLWWDRKKGTFFLGHDEPQYELFNYGTYEEDDWFQNHKIWWHCKNIESLFLLVNVYKAINFFYQDKDDATLTNKNIIWGTHPAVDILVEPKCSKFKMSTGTDFGHKKYIGICSDYVEKIRESIL